MELKLLLRHQNVWFVTLKHIHFIKAVTLLNSGSIFPDELITFLSDVFGGKASETHIFKTNEILEKCEVGGTISDKGFLEKQSCYNAGIKLIRPTFKGKNYQFSLTDDVANIEIAKAKVYNRGAM
ncbi:Harbinger transposase-derived nuclease domain [Cinara cedri]|uniref:Harbinger transposase-derived nuclease domain n=1 Tax=Cinara cedri TaxID=506608 RepID=A0A5E4MUP0_9HEMI|nr:Harbinger transposase-derived nuclease domain [Cinara cedri]